jgi:hypothetical protein
MMRAAVLTTALICVPAIVAAQQGSASTQAQASAKASAQTSVTVPSTYSADSRAKIEAAFQAARSKSLPDQPLQQLLAEAQAKGASEAQVVAAVQGVEGLLEASQAAMIHAGRPQPQQSEIVAGAHAMERGASPAQVESLIKHAPADRSLAVAFTVLAKLEATGEPVDNAIAKIGAKLDAGASDDAVASLVGGAGASVGAPKPANPPAAGDKDSTAGVTAAAKGAVSGVIGPKKP